MASGVELVSARISDVIVREPERSSAVAGEATCGGGRRRPGFQEAVDGPILMMRVHADIRSHFSGWGWSAAS